MSTAIGETTATVRACLFRLAEAVFAVEVGYAREVVVVEDFTAVPRAPAHLVGVTNLRGSVLPIVDIRPLLGLSGGTEPAARIVRGTKALVLQWEGTHVAVGTDGILGLASFDEVAPLGEAARREYGAFGVGLLTGERDLATLLDASRLLEALTTRTWGNAQSEATRATAGGMGDEASRH